MATILVTGANRGIGLSITRQLKERGDTVIAACRSTSEELSALGVQVEEGVDVGSQASVDALAQRLKGTQIDTLINNAGILKRTSLEAVDFESIAQQMNINAYGPLRVTAALLSNLDQGSKVITITSRMGSIADNTSGGMYGYRMSKAAVNMAGVSLARDLEPKGIAVALLHPGYVQTGMTGNSGHIGPDESATGLIQRMDDLSLATSGGFWHQNGESLPW